MKEMFSKKVSCIPSCTVNSIANLNHLHVFKKVKSRSKLYGEQYGLSKSCTKRVKISETLRTQRINEFIRH